jgi:hypothetical protein
LHRQGWVYRELVSRPKDRIKLDSCKVVIEATLFYSDESEGTYEKVNIKKININGTARSKRKQDGKSFKKNFFFRARRPAAAPVYCRPR